MGEGEGGWGGEGGCVAGGSGAGWRGGVELLLFIVIKILKKYRSEYTPPFSHSKNFGKMTENTDQRIPRGLSFKKFGKMTENTDQRIPRGLSPV